MLLEIMVALGPGRPTNMNLACVNECWTAYSGPDLLESRRLEAIKQLGIGGLRFPGGTESQTVQLETGETMPLDRLAHVFGTKSSYYQNAARRVTQNKTEPTLLQFAQLARLANVTPVWDLNIATATSTEVKAQVAAIRAGGGSSTFIEAGNELYIGYYSNCSTGAGGCTAATSAFPNGTVSYMERITPAVTDLESWAPPLANAPLLTGRDPGNAGTVWNDGLSDKVFPSVVVHLYVPHGRTSWNPNSMNHYPRSQWASLLAAAPLSAIRQTVKGLRSGSGRGPGNSSFAGTPSLWLTETNMGIVPKVPPPACCFSDPVDPGCCAVDSIDPNTFLRLAYFSPLAMLSKAGFLLGAATTPEVDLMCHHSLLQRGSGPPANQSGAWSDSPFGFLWMRNTTVSTRQHWPFPDDRPRINPAGQAFARITATMRASEAMHPLTGLDDMLIGSMSIYGKNISALHGAGFSAQGKGACYVLLNRDNASHAIAVRTSSSSAVCNATALVVPTGADGSRCQGNGSKCWAPLPHGPVPARVLPTQTHDGGTEAEGAVHLTAPAYSITFLYIGPSQQQPVQPDGTSGTSDNGGWCSAVATG
jgi:hypothetical protein